MINKNIILKVNIKKYKEYCNKKDYIVSKPLGILMKEQRKED